VRQVLAREKPVTNDGPHYPLPYPGGTGLGKPLKPIVHPLRADIPIILGAEGPKNVALAAEIADGWFPIFFSPKAMSSFEASLDEGFARPGARRSARRLRGAGLRPTVHRRRHRAAADGFRPYLALYIGGMGAKEMNFHFDVFARMGYEEAATKIQDAYLDGRKDDAAAAVPTAMVEEIALVGPVEKIRDDLEAWRESRATTMLINGDDRHLRTMAELVLGCSRARSPPRCCSPTPGDGRASGVTMRRGRSLSRRMPPSGRGRPQVVAKGWGGPARACAASVPSASTGGAPTAPSPPPAGRRRCR
jgi:alkanesulfonate monooxygenase SsuD/methylene tetrahydromethanopterin reductase-like flavin-dependent oxidoreductase (luciferase family)